MKKTHLLIVDDDKRIRELLERFLKTYDYSVTLACDSRHARNLLKNIEFDLIIMDIMMPGENGLMLTNYVSEAYNTPILLLSAKVETSEKILGLEMGADDYLSKPFEPRELVLRVEAILKRIQQEAKVVIPLTLIFGKFTYDTRRKELFRNAIQVHLTSTEIKLMDIFTEKGTEVVTREQILDEFEFTENQNKITDMKKRKVDVQIKRLRKKLEPNPKMPRYLKTVRGHGYRLVPD